GAVNGEVNNQLKKRPADSAEGDVAGMDISARHQQQLVGQAFEVARQGAGQHQRAGFAHLLHKIGGAAGKAGPQIAERDFAHRVLLQQGQVVHEFVAGGAVGEPVGGQAFAVAQDLFHIDGQVFVTQLRRTFGLQTVEAATQLATVGAWVGQPVHMVDPQPVHQPPFNQFEDLGVGRFEDFGFFYPQAAQLIDVEEASPVDV